MRINADTGIEEMNVNEIYKWLEYKNYNKKKLHALKTYATKKDKNHWNGEDDT